MAILPIVYYPDEPLTLKSKPVKRFDGDLAQLVEDMLDTMHAYHGVGLAAPQVGLAQRLFVLQVPDGPEMHFVNPEIVESDGREIGEEGCLSMPEVYAQVPRATRVCVRAQDVEGNDIELEATNFLARIIQHELDHLDGIMFPERLDILTREALYQDWNNVRARLLREGGEPGEAEIKSQARHAR
ncbi:MAG: peptide deformylase [Candidatus Hydrogenedentales bacterium]